jgi:ApaG protein
MATPDYSDTTTHDIRVGATGFYLPGESNPAQGEYVFGYRILIVNHSRQAVRLTSRQWVIIDGEGQKRHVQGHGVVGQTPRLEPGQAFKYSSFCPMETSWGTMEGSYRMQYDDGQEFDVAIGRFYFATDKLDSAEPDERLTQDADPSAPSRI